jgi:hypothetical protein
MPVYLMPGNHDDREQLRRSFPAHAYLGTSGHVQYSVSVGDLQLVALDSVEHGQSGGRLCQERLDWLEAQMTADDPDPSGGARYLLVMIGSAMTRSAVGHACTARAGLMVGLLASGLGPS